MLLMAYMVAGPILGERLQSLRRPGVSRLEFPGRYLPGWRQYLDPKRYGPEAVWYIRLLWVLQLVLPVALFVILSFFWT